MTEYSRRPPRGFSRLLYRVPIWLYRLGLGWLMGQRFLLLNHTGRKSGRERQVVLEVVRHDPADDVYLVVAGFGPRSDWYQNVLKTPKVIIQVGRRKLAATAVPLSSDEGGEAMVDYAHRHPTAARTLGRVLGYDIDGTEDGYRALGRQLPFVAFHPQTG